MRARGPACLTGGRSGRLPATDKTGLRQVTFAARGFHPRPAAMRARLRWCWRSGFGRRPAAPRCHPLFLPTPVAIVRAIWRSRSQARFGSSFLFVMRIAQVVLGTVSGIIVGFGSGYRAWRAASHTFISGCSDPEIALLRF